MKHQRSEPVGEAVAWLPPAADAGKSLQSSVSRQRGRAVWLLAGWLLVSLAAIAAAATIVARYF